MSESQPRILVLLPNNLGDVIMGSTILEGLRATNPGAWIDFFVEEGFEAGLELNPFIDRILRFPRRSFREMLSSVMWQEVLNKFVKYMNGQKANGYTKIINLCQHRYISHIAGLFEVPETLGQKFLAFGGNCVTDSWSQYLFAVAFARRCNMLHSIDIYRHIVNTADQPAKCRIFLTEMERNDAREFLTARGIDTTTQRLMVFQPGAAYQAKRWPIENFINLGKMLISDGWQIVVSGARPELDLGVRICEELGTDCILTAGERNFRESIALLSCAQGCVTPDTAIMHAAAALDVPTYALFGSTNPVETGPYGNDHWVFAGNCADKPCFCHECKTRLCFKSILPGDLFAVIKSGLVDATTRCEVYRTSIKSGRFELLPQNRETVSYYDKNAALLARTLFGDVESANHIDTSDNAIHLAELSDIANRLVSLNQLLNTAIETGDLSIVPVFERKKTELAQFTGIGAFITALLNIRLNSVSMLDVNQAIRTYRTILDQLCVQIRL